MKESFPAKNCQYVRSRRIGRPSDHPGAMLCVGTTVLFFLLAGLLALVIRLQLAVPENAMLRPRRRSPRDGHRATLARAAQRIPTGLASTRRVSPKRRASRVLIALQQGEDIFVAARAEMPRARSLEEAAADVRSCKAALQSAFSAIAWIFVESSPPHAEAAGSPAES